LEEPESIVLDRVNEKRTALISDRADERFIVSEFCEIFEYIRILFTHSIRGRERAKTYLIIRNVWMCLGRNVCCHMFGFQLNDKKRKKRMS